MTGTKTVAERLREAEGLCAGHGMCRVILQAINGEATCPPIVSCTECKKGITNALADMIEAEQAQAVSKALNGAKPQLPEGIEWPRFEDGELVRLGDEFEFDGIKHTVDMIRFQVYSDEIEPTTTLLDLEWVPVGYKSGARVKRPEPEVLDADGVPIKVGDTVYHEDEGECVVERIYRQNGDTLLDLDVCGASWNTANVKPAEVTHRKPDTLESIFSEMVSAIESEDLVDLAPYVERYRKLKGGE